MWNSGAVRAREPGIRGCLVPVYGTGRKLSDKSEQNAVESFLSYHVLQTEQGSGKKRGLVLFAVQTADIVEDFIEEPHGIELTGT